MWIARALTMGSIMMFAATSFLQSQALAPGASNPPFVLILTLQKNHIPMSEKRIAILEVASTGDPTVLADREIMLGCTPFEYRVHIEKDGTGEPAKTEYYRHILGDFREGDGPDQSGGSCVGVQLRAGSTVKQSYDLSVYYDLTKPGSYLLYIEFFDYDGRNKTGAWIRSNTAHFDVQAISNQ
jgi:hypothetical protein